MIPKHQIQKLIKFAKLGENDNRPAESDNLASRMVFGKVLIDRWDYDANTFFFHPNHKDFVAQELTKLEKKLEKTKLLKRKIEINFSELIPEDQMLVTVDLSDEDFGIKEITKDMDKDEIQELKIENSRKTALIPMPTIKGETK